MQKVYCSLCGQASFYELKKPIICGHCGKSFTDSFKVETNFNTEKDESIHDDDGGDNEKSVYDEVLKENLKRIAMAAAAKVQVNISKNLTLGELSKIENKIVREKSQTNQNFNN